MLMHNKLCVIPIFCKHFIFVFTVCPSIGYLLNHRLEFLNSQVYLSLMIVYILANSIDPADILDSGTFYLGLHCLPKYQFTGFLYSYG